MSPEGSRTFEAEWPGLATKLESFLARKGIPPDQREDLVQETGARLVGMWNSVDRNRPTWALTLTIALNIIRDRYRRGESREIASEVPDRPALYDLEQAGLARIELGRVKSALASLTAAQRGALMAELGHREGIHRPDTSADKMLRSRARSRLNAIVGRASAALTWPLRRAGEFIQAVAGSGEAGLQGLGCAACALLALGTMVAPHGASIASASTGRHSELFVPSYGTHQIDAMLEPRGVASRALAPGTVRDEARARRSHVRTSSTAAPTSSGTEPGVVPDPQPLPDTPPPPDMGRGAPKPPHLPLIEQVKKTLGGKLPRL